ncbi:MAG: DEAD/DEAH box helicase [Steroidobacteraceae bacterium]
MVAQGAGVMRWFGRGVRESGAAGWRADAHADGIVYSRTTDGTSIDAALFSATLAQWQDDGHVLAVEEGRWCIPWSAVYRVLRDPGYAVDATALGIPAIIGLAPKLVSRGALIDADFLIAIAGWVDADGQSVNDVTLTGAHARTAAASGILPERTWAILQRVGEFVRRSDAERNDLSHRLAWGEIRQLAVDAGARLDHFLQHTVVLSPERLHIGLRRGEGDGSTLVEVIPGFDGCPDSWLERFDFHSNVQDRYDLPTPHGIVQVIVRPEVKAVLQQIKRMPGRRAAGPRAEAFVANPFAALGAEASAVIDPEQFERERVRAGLVFDRFTAYVTPATDLFGAEIGLVIESGVGEGATSEHVPFASQDEARAFVEGARRALEAGYQLCSWNEYELELRGDSPGQLDVLEQAIAAGRMDVPHGTPGNSATLTAQTVYDLSVYSGRIKGIGIEKPYASPYIARKNDGDGWFPSNLVRMIELPPERPGGPPTYVPLDDPALKRLAAAVKQADEGGAGTVRIPGTNIDIPVVDAGGIVNVFTRAAEQAETGQLEKDLQKAERKPRKGLLIKPNVSTKDYIEQRNEALGIDRQPVDLPAALRPSVQLKAHQLEGVAWLQHLFRHSPDDCRGAVLADDMGLGKTLQLLTLIAWAHERDSTLPPALIVAPVALLENWRDEIQKFLNDRTLPLLEVYGDTLASLRVPKEQIDEQLKADGLVRFLKPGWVGRAKVVLTTYETLRDLEFSFAAEKWSIVVCDEAQKVKNPNALVTRAVKKQNARFRVACTGTPVENTLADLWCLFDFVQPGLLGALNEFGQQYRRPIEAETEDEKERVDELRGIIAPQILRRLKKDVAKDLPKKIERDDCKRLPMTPAQRSLYSKAVAQFGQRHDPSVSTPFRNPLGLLHYLRLVCTDPQPYGLSGFRAEPLHLYRTQAPKLDWLLAILHEIRARGDKALVFCEFKDIQRLLRHYIAEELGYAADIINGETASSSKSDQSRQKRIKAFQQQAGFGVIILSPLAVGFGVNIQAANHVIHYTRTWNPAKEDQATDRAYRIGQQKDVYVYCPVVAAEDFKTFDVKLDELIAYKRKLGDDMLNGTGDIGAGEFDVGEVGPPGAGPSGPRELSFDDVLRMNARVFEAYVAALWLRKASPCDIDAAERRRWRRRGGGPRSRRLPDPVQNVAG